jgi:hypothetical protein
VRSFRYRLAARKLFDPAFYLKKYPDVAESGMNPMLHYSLHGAAERRKPHPLFDPDYYLLRCPEVKTSGSDPLMHFLRSRGEECCSPHPLFDCQAYLRENAGARDVNPVLHYLVSQRPPSKECIQLEIQDVLIGLVFGEAQTAPQGCVRVWQDRDGRTQFIAPPQQLPFFRSLSFEQLWAQV